MRHRIWITLGATAVTVIGIAAPTPVISVSNAPVGYVEPIELGGPYIEGLREGTPPDDYYLFSRFGGGGSPSRAQLEAAALQARRVRQLTARTAPRLAAARWNYVGPSNIGARVLDIAVDQEREDTIYIAAASGGVWKSTDAGSTFTPAWPRKKVQSIGALAIGSDNTLWAGTGEANGGGGSIVYGGSGVFRSRDGGQTWARVGLAGSSTIGRIVVNPKDPDHVLVAVAGNLFKPGGPRGLYETKNGGDTWARILEGDTDTSAAVDVAIDPQDPKRIFVAMWDRIRYPDWRDYAGPGSGIYRSEDGGKTFERLGPANGLPAPAENIGRIGIGLDPSDPQRMYAIYINDLGTFAGWYTSITGGDAWVGHPTGSAMMADSQLVYGWWFGRVWVDPNDSNHVFVAGLPLLESTDGGQSFTPDGEMHVDQHALAWDPHKEGRVYAGNDGGVYRSEENGSGSWVHGTDQPWSQFYTIDVSELDPTRINGGLQDNGSVRSWGRPDGSWNGYNGGDGVKNAIHPEDPELVFACSQYGACSRSESGGGSMSGMDNPSTRFGWLTPIEFQPGQPDVMYWSGNEVARSDDRGASWESISPDLGEGDVGRERNPLYAGHYGTVQAIGLNKAKPEVIYAGTDNGLLWKTTDTGGTWTKLTPEALPDRWVTHITVKPNDPNVLYISFSGFRQGDQKDYLFRSKDGGETFTDISANLPRAPINDIVLVGRRLYVASDLGVFTSSTRRIRWLSVGGNLPNVPLNDLRWISKNKTLYVGTFGRGIYKIRPPV
ncbi:MAG TPA: glycosyl hydrolase [Actinomycetota bacterium]|nr:glycosyl hydrolase [Actinomycetota bacterium]